jgi:hypothetical protein
MLSPSILQLSLTKDVGSEKNGAAPQIADSLWILQRAGVDFQKCLGELVITCIAAEKFRVPTKADGNKYLKASLTVTS